MEQSREQLVLDYVLKFLGPGGTRAGITLHRAWVSEPGVICFVYHNDHGPELLGLRREVEQGPEWTIGGIGLEILECELGEPLGSMYDTLEPDDDGVLWWNGNLPEWKSSN